MEIKPIFFVTPGVDVFVKYEDDDGELEYFKGKVEKINYFCEDEKGSYVSCHVKYDNGDEVDDTLLYNHDFENPDSEDAWKLGTQISLLIKYLVNTQNDLKYIKEQLMQSDYDEHSEYEQDPEDDVGSEDPPSDSHALWGLFSGMLKFIVPVGLALYYKNDLCAIQSVF